MNKTFLIFLDSIFLVFLIVYNRICFVLFKQMGDKMSNEEFGIKSARYRTLHLCLKIVVWTQVRDYIGMQVKRGLGNGRGLIKTAWTWQW